MFFPERIISIKNTDRVLEVGPGGTPHFRSDVLLEKIFDANEASKQRGHTDSLQTEKEVVYYTEDKFPFKDNEFDYVICSHVLEHITEDKFVPFVNELQRVAKKGYIEYPTIYYEYLYNFKVHTTFLNYKDKVIYYMDKNKSSLNSFFPIQTFFYKTLENGYDEIVIENKKYFFQGFEWFERINISQTDDIRKMLTDDINLKPKEKSSSRSYIKLFFKKLFQ